jgi:hypothetical protein
MVIEGTSDAGIIILVWGLFQVDEGLEIDLRVSLRVLLLFKI